MDARTFSQDGTDITETKAKSYMELKKFLLSLGVNKELLTACNGLHALRVLGIRQGVLMGEEGEELEDDEAKALLMPDKSVVLDTCTLCGVIGHSTRHCPYNRVSPPAHRHNKAAEPSALVSSASAPDAAGVCLMRYSPELEERLCTAATSVGSSRKNGRLDALVGRNEAIMAQGHLPYLDTEGVEVPADCSSSEDSGGAVMTHVCVVNIDSLSAALALGDDTCILNFANAVSPGGGYLHGARAQEEDLCRLLPQLYPSLVGCAKKLYPIPPSAALLTRNVSAVRHPGTYKQCECLGTCDIITAAMPYAVGAGPRPGTQEWIDTVNLRMRAVLHTARYSGRRNLVLGAWGCGMFGNPPGDVAALFKAQLCSPEFSGAFHRVVFAILERRVTDSSNLAPFKEAFHM